MNLKQLRPFLLTLFCAALVITGLTAIARAQSAPEAVSATAAQTSSSFTFQGQLQDGGIPVNATCDIQAGLWDAETNGAQVGSTQTVTDVAVVDGRFTITLNANSEFGPEAFTGQARWLQIAVRCPTGSGSYSTLQPRQPLTAAPYAQSLLPGAVISGSVGTLTNAMLSLSNMNSNGVGLRIFDTGLDGVFVDRAGRDGVYVGSAQQDGLFICSTGNETGCTPSDLSNGIEIGSTQDHGIYIDHASGQYDGWNGSDGIFICSVGPYTDCVPSSLSYGIEIGHAYAGVGVSDSTIAFHAVNPSFYGLAVTSASAGVWLGQVGVGIDVAESAIGLQVQNATDDGVRIASADDNGVTVGSSTNAFWTSFPSADGLYVQSAGFNGVDVTGSNLAGYFGGAVQITGGCTGCLLANFGINTGQTPLEPGDVVVLTGSQPSRADSTPMLMEVMQANGQDVVVGVVMGRAEEVTVENPRPSEQGKRLIPREGPAQPGEFVTIVTYGLAPVRVGTANTSLTVGQRLTAGGDGMARSLQTVEVDGVTLNEAAPTLGIVLEAGDNDGDGLVWVLVNPN
ncbi:MAG: hypothetical protein KC445_09640 [Anaerolineales bacterium]|nr:hypothetical protein [Anaerolineales bacterium]